MSLSIYLSIYLSMYNSIKELTHFGLEVSVVCGY